MNNNKRSHQEIYTDGAYSSKTNKGGWSIVIPQEENHQPPIVKTGQKTNTTNNQMELTAILQALQYIDTNFPTTFVTIYCDSAYVVNCFQERWYYFWRTNGWLNSKKQPVANKELWEAILDLYEQHKSHIIISKVKAHDTNLYNNMADANAVLAREREEI